MAAPKKEEVALVQMRSNALVGSLRERMDAFDQIAANIASLALNGWKTAQMAKAACWLADGAGMHPAIFMQNHYVMEGKSGALIVEPKWEFIVAMLQSRVPGFKFEVLIETDDCAEVRMTDAAGNTQTVRYTLDDAKRQGLLGRGNAWTAGNTREMCFKQAVKRCGRRLSSAALMDLPIQLEGLEVQGAEEPKQTTAEAIRAEIDRVSGRGPEEIHGKATEVPFVEVSGASDEEHGEQARQNRERSEAIDKDERTIPLDPETARARLVAAITKRYGKLDKVALAERVAVLYNRMMFERTGVESKVTFTKAKPIGPVEAEQVIEYLEKPVPSAEPPVEEDEAPEAEVEAPPVAVEHPPEPSQAFDALMGTVLRARKLFKRLYVQETKANSGDALYWFTDQQTFAQVGLTAPVLLQRGPVVVAPQSLLEQLNGILAAACDDKERGGR